MSEHDTSSRTCDSKQGVSLDDDAHLKLECLVRHCIEYLKDKNHITSVKYPKTVKYLSEDIERKIENLTLCNKGPVWHKSTCKKIKADNKNIFDSPCVLGNLYALHVRCLGDGRDWKFKYIGVYGSGDLKNRLKEHLVKARQGTWSQLWRVAHAVANKHEIGVSFIMVESGQSHDKALGGYVEDRVIEWLRDEEQVKKWGDPWNKRKG